MIASKLRELRKARGLSQQEVSDRLGVPRGTYSIWEIGQRRPGLDSLITIADFYSVSLDYLLDRENVVVAASQAGDPLAVLTDEGRRTVERFIEFVHQQEKNE